jgi:hypothetical protein
MALANGDRRRSFFVLLPTGPLLSLHRVVCSLSYPVAPSWVTLRGYVRDAELFKDHAGAGLL